MKILYFSTRLPQPIRSELLADVKIYDGASGEVYSNSIFSGLAENKVEMVIVNVAPTGHYPKMNKRLFGKTRICEERGYKVLDVGSCNLFVYQDYSVRKHIYAALRRYMRDYNPDVMLIYALNIPIIKAALKYKHNYSPNSKTVLIVPDLIEDMYSGKDLHTRLKRQLFGDYQKLYEAFDGFVYVSELMKEQIGEEKPYCVVECMYNTAENFLEPQRQGKEKIIFYSGKLHAKFGAKHLVDAFMLTSNKDLRLQICGNGDSEDYIREMSQKDKRIEFLGQLVRTDVMNYQSKASLLINPRMPEGRFTRYSFPSKNMQYLASGVPTLIYKLPGIPAEYYDYCFALGEEDLSKERLAEEMEQIFMHSDEELHAIGEKARQWVVNTKNEKAQCKKMISFMESL